MKKLLTLIAVLLFVAGSLMATNEGTAGAQFTKILIGGRATSMGGAFTALADDASALYYNPAGLVKMNKNSILFNYIKWPAGIGFSYVGMVFPMGVNGSFGIQAALMSVPAMEVTTIESPEGTGEYFTVSNYYIGLSYARYFTDKLSVGITGKLIQEIIYDASSSMMAIDIGATYFTGFKSLRIGMAIRNFGSDGQFTGGTILQENITYYEDGQQPIKFSYVTEPYPLPLNFNVGVAYDILEDPDNFLTVSGEFQNPSDGAENMRIGAEYKLMNMAALRLGYIFDFDMLNEMLFGERELGTYTTEEKIEGLTAGVGFKTDMSGFGVGIDYAFTGMGLLGDSFMNGHRLSLNVSF